MNNKTHLAFHRYFDRIVLSQKAKTLVQREFDLRSRKRWRKRMQELAFRLCHQAKTDNLTPSQFWNGGWGCLTFIRDTKRYHIIQEKLCSWQPPIFLL